MTRSFLIFCTVVLLACGRSRNESNSSEPISDSLIAQPAILPTQSVTASTINIFIENSGSMNGYVNGNTQFKKVITKTLVLIKDYYGAEHINLFFINSDIHKAPIPGNLVNFGIKLNPATFQIGNVGSSDLNTIFQKILTKTDSTTISLLLTDCIYSIKGTATTALLANAQSLTMNAFLEKTKNSEVGYTTVIVKLLSDFNGNYFDKNDKPHSIHSLRPYYLFAIGTADVMADFNHAISLDGKGLEGFQNSYILSTTRAESPYWSVLSSTNKTGKFNASREASSKEYIRGIEDVEVSSRAKSNFTFSLGVDLSKCEASESYLCDPNNYEVSAGDYSVIEVLPVEQMTISPSDGKYSEQSTHIITLQANGTSYMDLCLLLKKKTPQWVYNSTNEDDTQGVDEQTTFGFSYVVEGIADAYERRSNSDNYLTINLTIRKSDSSPVATFFVILLVVGAVSSLAFLIYKRNKRQLPINTASHE